MSANLSILKQLKPWRGVILALLSLVFLLLFFDYNESIEGWKKYLFLLVFFAGISGVVLYFYDLKTRYRRR
jgi:ABC-type uncharacterized transport system permease subunit